MREFFELFITTPWGIAIFAIVATAVFVLLVVLLYKPFFKPFLDCFLAFIGLLVLSPLFLLLAIIIKATSKGPVFFRQKRVGKNKKLFTIHKFRTMRTDAPKDMPTHLLADPDQFITRIGKFLRKTSLDELPQIWDIFRLKMSIVGPRPALYNQDDLVAERDLHDANRVRPGLTGLAQVSGRDELLIPKKAKIDGEYVKRRSLFLDIKIFFLTFLKVFKSDGVVEGGTGTMKEADAIEQEREPACDTQQAISEDAGLYESVSFAVASDDNMADNAKSIEDIAQEEPQAELQEEGVKLQEADTTDAFKAKNILITGAQSYLGDAVCAWLQTAGHSVTVLDMRKPEWESLDFTPFDSVFHVAGIAHATGKKNAELYYSVNRDLAIKTAQKAKDSGVRQFIFASSMYIYSGVKENNITLQTKPKTKKNNCYGDSKLQADFALQAMSCDMFKVAVVRPPMIFGKDCKGNFPRLVSLTKMPLFPKIQNQRSMLHIDNLCEIIKLIIEQHSFGMFFPQNAEYFNTAELVKAIGSIKGKRVRLTRLFNWLVWLWSPFLPPLKKLFGSSTYDKEMSSHFDNAYQIVCNQESIQKSCE